jgi:hypothetical protein
LSTFSAAAQTASEGIAKLSPHELKQIKTENPNANDVENQTIRTKTSQAKPLMRGRHYKLKLNNQQRRWLMVWFHDARRTFNQAFDYALQQGWYKDPTAFNESYLQKEQKSLKKLSAPRRSKNYDYTRLTRH